jgi:hypothetical protein
MNHMSVKPLIKDLLRLTSSGDFLGRAGTFLIRKSPRATIWTIGITTSGFLANALPWDLPGFSLIQVILAPILVGGSMLSIGICLKYIPSKLWRQLTTIAEANDLNLMEDYRKSQVMAHYNLLWDKVFFHEAVLRYTDEERQAEQERLTQTHKQITLRMQRWKKNILDDLAINDRNDLEEVVTAMMVAKPLSDQLEKSRDGFLISSMYAMQQALPQSSQTDRIGFGLGLYEDFCDGAPFDRSDQKLMQQYLGHNILNRIKGQCAFRKRDVVGQLINKICGQFWFALVTRKIGMGVGKALKQLSDTFGSDRFNSQVLLWPGEEHASWMSALCAAEAKIVKLRRKVFREALGKTYEDAQRVLDRALLPSFELAADLRMHCDYEYCDGSLSYPSEDQPPVPDNGIADWQQYGYAERVIDRKRAFISLAVTDMAWFLETVLPTINRRIDDPVVLRAVKTLFHLDTLGLKTHYHKTGTLPDSSVVRQLIENATEQQGLITTQLITVRLHLQLAHIRIAEYRHLTKTLGYSR